MRYSILANELWVAGAGSGKTNKIILDAIETIEEGGRVLVVTYTINNQAELRARFIKMYGDSSESFVVKGLFSFYLEDMIRPYQRVLFKDRITSHHFTEHNPHIIPGTKFYKKNRGEKLKDGSINPDYYLTPCKTKAYSGLLAKLATVIAQRSKDAPAKRLQDIYQKVFFDEVQDLVGWDYSVIKSISKVMVDSICCVGDFRQTIYSTTFGHKAPKSPEQKIDYFVKKMKFQINHMAKNHRCIQPICDISDTIHAGLYGETVSGVQTIPAEIGNHYGVFIVKQSEVVEYIDAFHPQVLRWSAAAGGKCLPAELNSYTFGSSKGLGFDRVLVILPDKHVQFIGGNRGVFEKDKTEESRNKLYVAITRARFSLTFVVKDKLAENLNYPIWKPY